MHADLMAYKDRRDADRKAALDDLVRFGLPIDESWRPSRCVPSLSLMRLSCFRSERGKSCCSHNTGLFQARWTDRTLDESRRKLLNRQPHLERSVSPQPRAMTEHFADTRITGYEPLWSERSLFPRLATATV